MKQVLLILAVAVIASPATATIDRSNVPLLSAAASPPDTGKLGRAVSYNGVAYSNMSAFDDDPSVSGTSGAVSSDDYTSIVTDPDTILMSQFQFVGGVANADEVLFFDFYDTGGVYVDSFGVQFSEGGMFTWTVTMSVPFVVPNAGRCDMWADDGSVLVVSKGTWFMNSAAPTIGTTGPTLPGYTDDLGKPLNHKFEIISTPEPATISLLALGGLALLRRRPRRSVR
jgi:hypothetical protein